ncbi:PQQ-binding-like beta-propeller repeat protein [Streptomyces sp. NPDC052309]|uniref:outer membrane protein assembly factor BamB family protein n=1 Tax=Streptomyces sp. NPDC052309 TaxID=3155421 RepID=UPI00341BCED1
MSFENIFGTGGGQADSAKQSAEELKGDTPGARDVSGKVRDLERQRDPWLVRQTAHGAFDVMGFLSPFFQKFQDVSAAWRQVSENPSSTSAMASSAKQALGPLEVNISDKNMPKLEDLSKIVGDRRSFALIATDLGKSNGLAVDPAQKTAYVTDRGGTLTAVNLTNGARRVVASGLGDICDVKVSGNGAAYIADFHGRLLVVDVSNGDVRWQAKVPGAFGVALDGTDRAYVADWSNGQLIEVNLQTKRTNPQPVAKDLGGGISGVALDGKGKAYVGRSDGTLYEVTLLGGSKSVVTTLRDAYAIRVELDGAGRAYVADWNGGRLYEVTLTDRAHRVVATGLGKSAAGAGAGGLALDISNGQIYVSNEKGQLWQISQRAAQALGGVGTVVAPPSEA